MACRWGTDAGTRGEIAVQARLGGGRARTWTRTRARNGRENGLRRVMFSVNCGGDDSQMSAEVRTGSERQRYERGVRCAGAWSSPAGDPLSGMRDKFNLASTPGAVLFPGSSNFMGVGCAGSVVPIVFLFQDHFSSFTPHTQIRKFSFSLWQLIISTCASPNCSSSPCPLEYLPFFAPTLKMKRPGWHR